MNITTIPALLGVFALAFLVLLLAKVVKQPAADKTAKTLLILLFVGLISMASCLFYIYADLREAWPRLFAIDIGLAYWIGPSLYFYIKRLNGGPNPFARPVNYLHWLPAILIQVALLPFFLLPLEAKVAYLAQPSGIFREMIRFAWVGFNIHMLIYIFASQPHLRAYQERLLANYSEISFINFRWLQLFCYGLTGELLVEWMFPLLTITPSHISDVAGTATYFLIIVLAYTALGQSRLQFAPGWQPATSPAARTGKYTRSGLRDTAADYYLAKLERLMQTERFFLESDLSLQVLAARLEMSPHHLSQLLNEKLRRNFYDYINELRVNYAKQLLLEDVHKPVTDIAFDVGYNNKKSFYNAFKRHAGMKPSEYRSRPRP